MSVVLYPLRCQFCVKIPISFLYLFFNSNFTGTALEKKRPDEYFHQYISRDVVLLVGKDDTKEGGDQYCPALLQGGTARRDRNYNWWGYINTLARTKEPVELFNKANFTNLPDWSWGSDFKTRLVVIEDAEHDPKVVFKSEEGRAALFSWGDVQRGWRPDGYDDQDTDCQYCEGFVEEGNGAPGPNGKRTDENGGGGGGMCVRK